MPVKTWCDHTEGVEPRLTLENWDVLQEQLLQIQSVMMNMAPTFVKNNLQLGTDADSKRLRNSLLRWCYYFCNLGESSTTSEGNGTGADDDNRMPVDSLKNGNGEGKGKHPKQKCTCTGNTDVNNCKNCSRTGHCVKDCWRPGGAAHDNSDKNQRKGKKNTTNMGKGQQVDVV